MPHMPQTFHVTAPHDMFIPLRIYLADETTIFNFKVFDCWNYDRPIKKTIWAATGNHCVLGAKSYDSFFSISDLLITWPGLVIVE